MKKAKINKNNFNHLIQPFFNVKAEKTLVQIKSDKV